MEAQPLPHEECPQDGGQSGSLDASCDVARLEDAVSRAAGWRCEANGLSEALTYAVVIDCEGRAIDLLGPMFPEGKRQAWLDSLANDRRACFAGQSVQFTCKIYLFPP
ncbi:MAG: hypothetical protein JXP73_21730 [Deltaproteobacteria bacterium]|nr:hypothetical protein [Deltaproteobacteria bacterium]